MQTEGGGGGGGGEGGRGGSKEERIGRVEEGIMPNHTIVNS